MVDLISSGLGICDCAGGWVGVCSTWFAINSLNFIASPVLASFKWTILRCDHSTELFNFVASPTLDSVNWTILC